MIGNFCRLLCCVMAMLSCSAAEGSVQAFLQASRSWLPDGPVIMTREAVGEAIGLAYAGYDPTTGAWFMAGPMVSGGRDASGRSYLIKAGQDEIITPVHEPLPYHIGTLLPVAILASMHERPGIITEAVQRDGSWLVTYRVTMDRTKSPPVTKQFVAQFDAASGRMLSHERSDAEDRQRVEFDLSNPRLERMIDRDGGPQHKVSLESDVTAASFTPEAIRARMKAADIAIQQKSAAVLAGYVEDGEGNWSPPSREQETIPYAGNAVKRFRIPLILLGVVLAGVAAIELFRRRGAA